jgi:Flp pilus assembly pilin Flp
MLNYLIARLHHGEEGQTMAEYAVVLAVITVAIVATLTLLSNGIRDTLTNVIGDL